MRRLPTPTLLRRSLRANPRGAGLKLAAAAGVFMLAIMALVFAGSSTTRDLVVDGRAAQLSESALGANDVAFKSFAQLVLLAEDKALGIADANVVDEAAEEAQRSLDDLAERVDALIVIAPEAAPAVTGPLGHLMVAAEELFEAISRSDDAGEALAGSVKPASEALRNALAQERTQHVELLLAAGNVAGSLGTLSRFLVAFILPLAAIIAYRVAVRRQLRLAEVQLDAQLAAEHEIHKAKDEFIAGMSHELRTPLTSIYGFSELLIESGAVDPVMTMDLVEMINSESAELGRMVEDLLVSARSASDALSYSLQDINLQKEIDSIVAPFVRGGASIRVDMPNGIVRADPLRARQIARNLVSNAVRHGGPEIIIIGKIDAGSMAIGVADNGPGVPEQVRDRLFARFVHDGADVLTTGSVGLGLAVAKELAAAMGGDVTYERNRGWTVFSLRLPLAEQQAAPTPLIPSPPLEIPTVPPSAPVLAADAS